MDPTVTAAVIGAAAVILAALIPIFLNRSRKSKAIGASGKRKAESEITQDRVHAFLHSAPNLISHLESLEAILHDSWQKKLTPEDKEKVAILQRMGVSELARIDDVLDRFAQRKKTWGGTDVDIFREVLSMSSPGMGTGLFRHAIGELNLVIDKLKEKDMG